MSQVYGYPNIDSLGKWYYAGYEPGTRNGYELAQQAIAAFKDRSKT